MADPVVIRSAHMTDYPGFEAVFREGVLYHRAGRPDVFREPGQRSIEPDQMRAWLDDPDHLLLLAFDADRCVGYLLAMLPTHSGPITHDLHSVMIEQLIIAETHRGAGIGRRMMAEAEAWGKAHGANRAQLNVWAFNQSAIHFYEQLGYSSAYLRLERVFEEE